MASGYDVRKMHRLIVTSRTYQQSTLTNETNRGDTKNYSRFYLRRLSAEVMVDAVNHATGGQVTFPDSLYVKEHPRAIEVPSGTVQPQGRREKASLTFAFDIFGRPKRDIMMMCDCERDNGATVMHTLYLANNPRVRDKISAADGRVSKVIETIAGDAERIDELFLWALSRLPSTEERQAALDAVRESQDTHEAYEDVLWGLLNTREFLLQH